MTKSGSSKSKALGRLIFGEKRKQHPSPSRHQPSAQNLDNTTQMPWSNDAATSMNSIDVHDWAIWRMQLNEQMGNRTTDQRSALKQLRQFLQSNPFYQQYSRDPLDGRFNGVQLLFSIPRVSLKLDALDTSGEVTKNHSNDVSDRLVHEERKARLNNDDQTSTNVNSSSVVQPMMIDKTSNQLFSKGLVEHRSSFLQANEQIIATDGIHPCRSNRSSFMAPDRIHSTLQKTVKDGNVLEKIKAFEMQAAAAQAKSITKLNGTNHRMLSMTSSFQSTTCHRSNPAAICPLQQAISLAALQNSQEKPIRFSRAHYVHSVRQRSDSTQDPNTGHKSRKGVHVLEPAHGDIILKRRTPSQKTVNDEDYSMTAVSSLALTTSQNHCRNNHLPSRHHHHHRHRTNGSHSRHRQEMTYERRTTSKNETTSHKHQQKQKGTSIPLAKSSTYRRCPKGQKEIFTEDSIPDEKQQLSVTKSNQTSLNKKKPAEHEKADSKKATASNIKGRASSDNSRVYGVPYTNANEQKRNESQSLKKSSKLDETGELDSKRNNLKKSDGCIPTKLEQINQNKECDTIVPMTNQLQLRKNHHQPNFSNTDGEALSKIDDDNRFSRPTDDYAYHSEPNDDDNDNVSDKSEDDVFIEESPVKPIPIITHRQSIVNLPKTGLRHFQQQSSNSIRQLASQCSADEFTSERCYRGSEENLQLININILKEKPPPITLITRKNKSNQDDQIVYEPPHSEQIRAPVRNSHTLRKNRPFHTINVMATSNSNGQNDISNNNNKQISKQILHAIMNSMNNNQEQSMKGPPIASSSSVNDEFFEKGPLTNPEETIANITTLAEK